MKWICIVCEKELFDINKIPLPLERALFPNLEGGTMEINFGYGSEFDDGMNSIVHHSCICDECWKKKRHLTRAIVVDKITTWKELPSDYHKSPEFGGLIS